MPENDFDEFLAIRKPGAHLDGVTRQRRIRPVNSASISSTSRKFAKVDDERHLPEGAMLDVRWQTTSTPAPSSTTTAAPTGPTCASRTSRRRRWPPSCSRTARTTCSSASTAGPTRSPGVTAPRRWPRSSGRHGPTRSSPRSTGGSGEFLPDGTVYEDPNQAVPQHERSHHARRLPRAVHPRPGAPRADQAASWSGGSSAATSTCCSASRRGPPRSSVRDGLDEMFDIQYTLWGDTVLPGVKKLKEQYLGITGDQVEDWMKDLQIDATAFPGKAFDLSFEMPEDGVGIMTFNRCVAVDQWEGMGRPDILEKNCHSTCPKSMIVTTEHVQPEHEGRHPRHPAPQGRGRRVLQVALQHARRVRSRVRPGGAHVETPVRGVPPPRGARDSSRSPRAPRRVRVDAWAAPRSIRRRTLLTPGRRGSGSDQRGSSGARGGGSRRSVRRVGCPPA